jgi:N-acetylmuramoyl-L-alanine amidase
MIVAVMTRIVLCLALALCAAAGGEPARALQADVAEITGDAAETAVAIRFDAPPQAESFRLADPDRIVIDLPETAWRLDPPAGAGLAERLRFGLAAPGRSRLVIDLAAPARLAGWSLEPRDGGIWLTLRLAPESRAAFDAAAGWPAGAAPAAAGRGAARRLLVALDPGHGGVDGGAERDGLVEKRVVLDFGRRLADRLRDGGFDVMMTREADVFVPLAARVERARAAGADLLLSLHADVVEAGDASGVSVYTLSAEASDPQSAALAARENAVDLLGGDLSAAEEDIAAALIALVRRETMVRSEKLAAALIDAFGARVPVLSGRPHRHAGFRVLKGPDLPSALIELGFLSNAADRARLADPVWREQALTAIVAAVSAWERAVRGTLLAAE